MPRPAILVRHDRVQYREKERKKERKTSVLQFHAKNDVTSADLVFFKIISDMLQMQLASSLLDVFW